jgi:hypothetical protein
MKSIRFLPSAYCRPPTANCLALTACRLLPSDSRLLNLQFQPLTRGREYGSLP